MFSVTIFMFCPQTINFNQYYMSRTLYLYIFSKKVHIAYQTLRLAYVHQLTYIAYENHTQEYKKKHLFQ